MSEIKGLRQVAYVDCKGGGQVVVRNGAAYVGHTEGPEATTVIDVRDRKKPKIVETIMCKHQGVHAHKVRVANDLMLTNYESIEYAGTPSDGFRAGLTIYDASDPLKPKPINFWATEGAGVHRFTFDGTLAYLSTTMPGYSGRIVLIVDLSDPMKPKEVGRWHWPGQWIAGGESLAIPAGHLMCHHPIRRGDRLYVSYWLAGWAILDISDISKPKEISRVTWQPPFAHPTHTCLPVPFKVKGMDILVVADEDVAKTRESGPAFAWIVDISDEAHPMPFASFQVPGLETGIPAPAQTGCHQPVEEVRSTEIPFAWFAQGLRIVDIADPHAPREVAYYKPDPPAEYKRTCGNDVYQDDDGLIYLIDRRRGLHIVERV
jgi:hypothetical protein